MGGGAAVLTRVTTFVAVCVVTAACATAPRTTARVATTPAVHATATTASDARSLSALPCNPNGVPAKSGEITFVTGGRLYSFTPDGSSSKCLADGVGPGALAWGPRGDRVVVGGRESIFTAGDFPRVREPGGPLASFAVSAPKGTAIVFIPSDHAHLMKVNTIGQGLQEISFLSRQDDVVYHPAGTHLAVVGEGPGRSYGIWQSTNLGEKPRQLAHAETARRVYSLSYAQFGFLAFAADHGDHFDVHWLAPSGQLETAHSGPEPVDDVVASPFSDSVAYRMGVCGRGRTSTHAWVDRRDRPLGGKLAEMSTEPAGWLPDGRLVVLARSHGCDGPADVYVWTENASTLLMRGVDRVAVRAVLPPPPPPPGAPGEAKG